MIMEKQITIFLKESTRTEVLDFLSKLKVLINTDKKSS